MHGQLRLWKNQASLALSGKNNFLALPHYVRLSATRILNCASGPCQHVLAELSAIATLHPWHPETPVPNPRVAPSYATS